MLSDLLRNLTFNRSAHCTQVSDQCPLGLLFVNNSSKIMSLSVEGIRARLNEGFCCNFFLSQAL